MHPALCRRRDRNLIEAYKLLESREISALS